MQEGYRPRRGGEGRSSPQQRPIHFASAAFSSGSALLCLPLRLPPAGFNLPALPPANATDRSNDENGNARNLLAVRQVLAVQAVVSSSPLGFISASQKGAASQDSGIGVWRYFSGNQRIGDSFWSLKRYQQVHARQGFGTSLSEKSLYELCEVECKSGSGLELASTRSSNCGLKALSKVTRK